jgi:uncharacterized membrane-anchored protein
MNLPTKSLRHGPMIAGCGLMLAIAASAGPVLAQDTAAPVSPAAAAAKAEAARAEEVQKAYEAVIGAGKQGPAVVVLLDQAVLKLPPGYIYAPKREGDRLMRAFGNRTGPNFAGIILPTDNAAWLITLDYNKAGYVRDDDAKVWKADELLATIKEGTLSGNDDRRERGFPPIEVTGWVEPPAYQADTHRLVWAANVRRIGQSQGGSVNYNTYALGREGYFELNMIGSGDVIMKEKGRAKELLAALTYVPGKSYEEFQAGTDRVAEYGLAALVAGVAAKKLGFFALIAVAALKAWKLVALALFGGLALIGKLFGRKSPPSDPPAA